MSQLHLRRIIAAGVLGIFGLAISLPCFGQAPSGQSRDHRMEAAETDITLLKRLIKDQDRRIAELEKTIKTLRGAASAEEATPHETAKAVLKKFAAPWHNPLAWTQIREGLSRLQVEEILGKPTSVEAVIDSQTLYYKGDVPSSGTVTGVIKLTDDRVTGITLPAF